MTSMSRVTRMNLVALGVLVLAATSWAQTRPPIVDKLAKTYGLDSWDRIEGIRYTFHLDWAGLKLVDTWEWEPKTGKVSFEGKDKDGKPVKVTYLRSELSSQSEAVKKEVDPAFINDNYWLLFPFHAYWDTSATVIDKGMQKLPAGTGSAKLVQVKYPSGGYTPGDTWGLYVGSDDRIQEMIFHHGGSVKPSVAIATWTGYKKAGPLLISTEHRGTADGKPLRIFFSDVSVKVPGSDNWISAQ